jgi:hypothetical protein
MDQVKPVEFKEVQLSELEQFKEALWQGAQNIYVRVEGRVVDYKPVFTAKMPHREYARFRIEGDGTAVDAVVWPFDLPEMKDRLIDGACVIALGKLVLGFREELELQVSALSQV